jgi:ABC-type dipeptide/oligopeptide/nickel transport system permease subunit
VVDHFTRILGGFMKQHIIAFSVTVLAVVVGIWVAPKVIGLTQKA